LADLGGICPLEAVDLGTIAHGWAGSRPVRGLVAGCVVCF